MNWVVEPISTSLLARVEKFLNNTPPPLRMVGLHSSTTLAMLLAQTSHGHANKLPHLVVTADLETAEELQESLKFFDPLINAPILPPFDVGVYSNLYPNQRVIAQRLSWLFAAKDARPGHILIAPVAGLMQKTLPYKTFTEKCIQLTVRESLPDDFNSRLQQMGYQIVPTVEDVGGFCIRGGIIDLYSPSHPTPLRIELFGDIVESIRTFDLSTQMSIENINSATILPAREALFDDENRQQVAAMLSRSAAQREVSKTELNELLRAVSLGQYFYGVDFLLPYFYERLSSPLDYFSTAINYWIYDRSTTVRAADQFYEKLKGEYSAAEGQTLRVLYSELYSEFERIEVPPESKQIGVDKINLLDTSNEHQEYCEIKSFPIHEFSAGAHAKASDPSELARYLADKFRGWSAQGHNIILTAQNQSVAERLRLLLERADYKGRIIDQNNYQWSQLIHDQKTDSRCIPILLRSLRQGFRLPEENIVFITAEDLLSKKRISREAHHSTYALERAEALSFGELQVGDFVVHRIHGIGIYKGLKTMAIEGADAEFIELNYKDGDRLYLPVYRIGQLHKYSGPNSVSLIDKLGGTGWQKTQTKVRSQLRDVADRLLRLYAKRAQLKRNPYDEVNEDYYKFENSFPYQETDDQLRAINDVLQDFQKDHPMDRLICGDVGFGKTEVALRAAFRAVQEGKQVALIAPTTILTYQHYENFKKRMSSWPVQVRALNRFVPSAEVKKTVTELTSGAVDIVIGTHRLLSKDIQFKNLGLLIIDEEQKFGVVHKERLRHMRENVDTIALSATPIPRTLNMSLVGIRDLSLINTAPEDRLPTRTFVCKFDPETIRKSIESELARGGQVFFLHNRVQSIEECAAELRSIVPAARMAIAHGQMDEEQLEKTMLQFFNHELDVLICTAIIESGMDIPRANTIFINNAQTFGVSQLYQLRGRVGRSKERAYCYLMLPNDKRIDPVALERLKIIQENTALGSGIRVAQYDLELRGAGDILGEDQSGHINAVGYELYTELLEEAIQEQKGMPSLTADIEPEINLRVPALLPDKYIPDIRLRLYYYKTLSNIRSLEDVDRVENELRDQFGAPPEPVMNLLGLMVIRKFCRDLGVRDISAGKNTVTLAFTEKTKLPPQEVIKLTARENKKYQLTPEQRLKVRMNELSLPRVIDELEFLLKLCPV